MACTCTTGRSLLAKQQLPAEAERAARAFFEAFAGTVDDVRGDLVEAVRAGDLDPSSTNAVRVFVEDTLASYTSDFEVVFRDGVERGAEAGRAVAARRFDLDVAFDVVPESTLRELDDWAVEASHEVTDRFADDITGFIRSAHEEGLSIRDLSETLNDDLFEGRLQDWEAERVARTETISSSNAGSHSAYEEASSVVGEEWLTELDGDERDSHAAADGQIVAVGTTFVLGTGAEAQFPGDPGLAAEDRINCRCTVVPVFTDDLSESEIAVLESGGRLNAPA